MVTEVKTHRSDSVRVAFGDGRSAGRRAGSTMHVGRSRHTVAGVHVRLLRLFAANPDLVTSAPRNSSRSAASTADLNLGRLLALSRRQVDGY